MCSVQAVSDYALVCMINPESGATLTVGAGIFIILLLLFFCFVSRGHLPLRATESDVAQSQSAHE